MADQSPASSRKRKPPALAGGRSHRSQLGKEAKNHFEDAKKLVKKTVQFMHDSNVRDMILGMEKK